MNALLWGLGILLALVGIACLLFTIALFNAINERLTT
jgi:hypothetical protein